MMKTEETTEKDILHYLDDALAAAQVFGYSLEQRAAEEEAIEKFMTYLKEDTDISKKQWMKAEEMTGEMVVAVEKQGFKRGFGVAIRLVMEGMAVSENILKE